MSILANHSHEDQRERLLDALALVLAGLKDPEAAAMEIPGTSAEQLLSVLESDQGMMAVSVRLDELRDSGALLKAQALPVLEKLVQRIHEIVDAGDVSASAAPKLADVVFKMSGLAEERAARLRAQADEDAPRATVITLFADDPEPAPAKPNEHRVIIRLPTAHRRTPNVIDVTPSDEGDDDGA